LFSQHHQKLLHTNCPKTGNWRGYDKKITNFTIVHVQITDDASGMIRFKATQQISMFQSGSSLFQFGIVAIEDTHSGSTLLKDHAFILINSFIFDQSTFQSSPFSRQHTLAPKKYVEAICSQHPFFLYTVANANDAWPVSVIPQSVEPPLKTS
jgi:hypothetical protein